MRMIASLLLLAAAACASAPEPQSAPAREQGEAFRRSEAPDPSPLASYDIPSGRCGMILWARSGGRTVPIFRSVDVTTATMTVEGEKVALLLQSQDGDLRLGMRAQQLFAASEEAQAGLTVMTKLEWGQPFPSGTYVRGGTLTLTGSDGWQRILPVAGIAGCKA